MLWSLSIEEAFYLGFLLACLLLRRERWLFAATAALALALPLFLGQLEGRNEIWQEKAYLPGMSAIAAGIAAAIVAARARPNGAVALGLCAAGGIGLLVALLWGPWLWKLVGNGTMLVFTLSTACLLLGLHWRQRLAPCAGLRGFGWLRAQGRRSYEIYLTHMFVVYSLVALFKASGADTRSGWLWYLPAVLPCWGLGKLVGRGFSDPVERALLLRWLGGGNMDGIETGR